MKRINLLLIIILAFSSPLFSQVKGTGWKKLINEPTFDVRVNPLNPNTIFVGGEGRVMYRSYDAGQTWDTLVVGYRGGSAMMNNIFIHPIDTNVVIAGGLNFGDVRRTTNHGTNPEDWEIVLQADRAVALNGKALVMKPDDPNVFYIGDYTTGTFFRSTNRGITWDSISTIYTTRKIRYSTSDPYHDTLVPVEICSISIREDSTNIVFIGSCYGENFLSTDGGYTWQLTDVLVEPEYWKSDCEVTMVVFSPRDPLVGYAVITFLAPLNLPNGGLHKTTDGGYTWDLVAFADTSLWTVAIRPNDIGDDDDVYVGGYTEHFYTFDEYMTPGRGMIRRSQDGGKAWMSYDEDMDWKIEQINHQTTLNSLCIVADDESYLFAVGDKASTIRSGTGGYSWYLADTAEFFKKDNLNSVYFATTQSGFAVGDKGMFVKSTNDGRNFIQQASFTDKNLNSIFLIDSINGAICGDDGAIFITNDACNSWTQTHSSLGYNLKSILFVDKNIGYAAGESRILKTIDGGSNWFELYQANELNINEIHFNDANIGFAVGDNGIILKTADAGNTWRISDFQAANNLYSVCFLGNTGFAVGDKGAVVKSYDLGESWENYTTVVNRNLRSVRFKDLKNVTICGERNTIMRIDDTSSTWSTTRYDYGPRNNMWSQRIFKGANGFDRVYTASEAGFFMLDLTVDVLDDLNIQEMSNLNVYKDSPNSLSLTYDRKNPTSKLLFRVVDLTGKLVFQTGIDNSSSRIFEKVSIPNISKGVYLCQMQEDGDLSNKLIVIE
ncbi:MAG: hypothetical protein GX121_05085 [Ignavibacteria bacterium]|nr:hypothetical protein [Ignavibacteria bacterium]